jgi:SsrA-binding protein
MNSKNNKAKGLVIRNKQASFEYTFIDKYIAGIVLTGTEIKSIRKAKVSLQEAYCYFKNGELWVKNMHIAHYEQGNIYNHQENRERKLLLTRKELNKLIKNKEKGLTIVTIQLFIDQNNRAKLEIALAKGKKLYDKRQHIKERDVQRDLARQQITKL